MLYRPSGKGEVLLQEDDTGLAPPKASPGLLLLEPRPYCEKSWLFSRQDLTGKTAAYFLDTPQIAPKWKKQMKIPKHTLVKKEKLARWLIKY